MVSAPYEVEPGTTRPRRMPAIVVSGLAIAGTTGLLLARGPVLTIGVVLAVAVVAALILNVELAALVFVAIAPFEGYAKSVSGSAVKALGAVLFVSWIFRVLTRGAPLRLAHPVVRAAGVLLAALLASTVLHQNGALGTQVLVRYLSYIGALVVLVDCMQDRLAPQRVARVYVAACSVAAFVGLIAFFRHNLRASGPVGDPNDFAFFLLAALPLCIALRHDALHRRLYDLAALTMMLAILATLSRGALIGVAGMLAYAIAAHWLRPGVVTVAATLAGVATIGVMVVDPTKLSTSLHAKNQVAQRNVDERLIRWEAAAEMTYDNPLLGLGPAGFRENYDRYIDYQETNLVHQLDVAHEMYLEVSSELGVTGLLAFLCVVGFGYRGARQCARGCGADARLASAVCVALVGTAVAAIFLTEQYFLPLWLLAAVGAAMQARPSSPMAAPPAAIVGSTGAI